MEEYHSIPKEFDNDNDNSIPPSIKSFFSSYNDNNSKQTSFNFSNDDENSRQTSFKENSQNGDTNSRQNDSNLQPSNNNLIQEQFNNIGFRQCSYPENDEDDIFKANQQINFNNDGNNQFSPQFVNTSNLNEKNMFQMPQYDFLNQQIDNRTTRFTTKTEDNKIKKIENIEIRENCPNLQDENKTAIFKVITQNGNIQKIKNVDDEEEQKESNNNNNIIKAFNFRNEKCTYQRIFFTSLLDFLYWLIEDKYRIKIKVYIDNKDCFIRRDAKGQRDMLMKTAKDALIIDISKIKFDKQEEAKTFNEFLNQIYKISEDKKDIINSVLNHNIKFLMDIYRERINPEEKFKVEYQNFDRFKKYYNSQEKKELKEKVKIVSENYEQMINTILDKELNQHKKGPKAH